MRHNILQFAKLGLSGALIAAIGWAMLAVDPSQPGADLVQSAQADVFSFDFAPESKHRRFVRALSEEGFEQPRGYNWNGNQFFFTLKHDQRKQPLEVGRELQVAFERNKVNKKAHMTGLNPLDFTMISPKHARQAAPEHQRKQQHAAEGNLAMLDDFFQGGVIPFTMANDYVSMSGADPKQDVDSATDFMLKTLASKQPLEQQIKGMYNIESFKSGPNRSTTTAVWSDKELDMEKFKEGGATNANPDLPACIGCTLKMRFQGTQSESPYAANVFVGAQGTSPELAQSFYQRALPSRGWRPTDNNTLLTKLRTSGVMPHYDGVRIQTFARGHQFMTVMSHDNNQGGTTVQVYESP